MNAPLPAIDHAPIAPRKTQIRASDLPHLLDAYAGEISILSLDCFDTLLWRQTAAPKDVFALLAQSDIARKRGVTAYQRISAAAAAHRAIFVSAGSRQVHLSDIYQRFISLSDMEQAELIEAEIQAEIAACFAFQPCVDLIRQAHRLGIKIIIVSDIYLRAAELRRLLSHHLPADVMDVIAEIYCSVDAGISKSDGLFSQVLQREDVPPGEILHIGDHAIADAQAPRRLGLRALHFLQFDRQVVDFLRLQQAAASLIPLAQAAPSSLTRPRFSPFRALCSAAELRPYAPETLIGYMSFGPILYAYARFLTDGVKRLQQQGKRVKVFFLLRDAYLLSQACDAFAGEAVGTLLRIRKFVAIAASFKTRADIDYYISGIKPEFYNFHVIAEQLLLPPDLATAIIQIALGAADPQAKFHDLLHQDDVQQLIFTRSAGYRERLKRYMLNEMQLEEGDTIILADTGFIGVTQDYLTRTFQDELNVEFLGRYVLASPEPGRPNCEALITTTWCDHSLFEQSCTFKEGAVIDYSTEGAPIYEPIRLSDEQYEKVRAVQSECCRFIRDAKAFFTTSGITHDAAMLQETAHAALLRHVYMPLEEELEYFRTFQHDKDMGRDGRKTVYNIAQAGTTIKEAHSPYKLGPYETRAVGLDLTFSTLLQRSLQLELLPADMTLRSSPVKIFWEKNQALRYQSAKALYLQDGYFSLVLPYEAEVGIGLVLGEHYAWVQIDKIKLLNQARVVSEDMSRHLALSDIKQHGSLYECLSPDGAILIKPLASRLTLPHYYQIIFRPLTSARWFRDGVERGPPESTGGMTRLTTA